MGFQLLSIRVRLLCLTLGLLIPVMVAGFFNLRESRNSSRALLDESLKQQAGLAAAAFEQRLLAFRQTLEAISVLAANNESRYALQDYIDSIVKTRRNWQDIQIVNSSGEVILSQSKKRSGTTTVSIESLIREAEAENSFVVSTEQFAGDSVSLLSLARPIGNGTFVLARIDGSSVSDVFKNLDFPKDNIIAVFDKKNRLLYRSRVPSEQMSLDVSGTPLLAALDERREGTIEVESPYDGIARVYGLARVHTIDSAVAVGVPSNTLYEPVRRHFVRQLSLGLFLLFVAVMAAYAIARSITRPMNRLTKAARHFGAGDLSVRADIGEDGTLGELGETFDQMAEQIARREHGLKALDRLKSEFVSSVSHELRTPLTTIKTLARVLQSDKLSSEDRMAYLATIAVECDRQIDFVQNLLDLSRIESGAFRVTLAKTDVVQVLHEGVATQKEAARARGLQLVFIPPAEALPPATTDQGALSRIVRDLIDNAIKYSPTGADIFVRIRQIGDRIAVEISDNGCGIASEDLPHVFEKFYRGRPLSPNLSSGGDAPVQRDEAVQSNGAPGVGLGLYLAYNLVEQIDGDISVESPVDGETCGTRFTVFLPIASS